MHVNWSGNSTSKKTVHVSISISFPLSRTTIIFTVSNVKVHSSSTHMPFPFHLQPVEKEESEAGKEEKMEEEEEGKEEMEEEEEVLEVEEEEKQAQHVTSLVLALSQRYNPMRNSSPSCQSNKPFPLQVRCSDMTVSHTIVYHNNYSLQPSQLHQLTIACLRPLTMKFQSPHKCRTILPYNTFPQ